MQLAAVAEVKSVVAGALAEALEPTPERLAAEEREVAAHHLPGLLRLDVARQVHWFVVLAVEQKRYR